MDGLSVAANVIAVIDISAQIASLLLQYSKDVMDAKSDIERLKRKVEDIKHVLEEIDQLLDGHDKTRLSTTQRLSGSLEKCEEELKSLKADLEPSETRRAMRKIGLRALKWPFKSKRVDRIVMGLERYVQIFGSALQVDQTAVVLNIDQKLDLAKLPIAQGASYDSHTEEHNARCLPNTRTALLCDITNWAQDKNGKPIFWLSGMAGTGKSTIARTIAASFNSLGYLGASFFFKRGEGERGNASRFFTTIATHLAACEPGMLPGIRKALDEDSTIPHKALKDQFEKLILQPLLGIKPPSQALTRVVVIDALDECEQEGDIRTILQLLARTKDVSPVPLRIVVTSRPELHIRLGFREMPNGTYQDLVLHEVSRSTIEHDIRLFLEHELGVIRKERNLSPAWPTEQQILALVELAVPLFIYAATICRYIGGKGGSPTVFLAKVLQYKKSTFSQLDRTYLPILDQLLSEQEEDEKETWLQTFREVVGSIVVLENPLSAVSLANLLQIPKEEIQCRLDSLHSVLSVPSSEGAPIRLLHLSFRDFLTDPLKKGKSPFWIDDKSIHQKLASHCLDVMSGPSGLHRDVCGLQEPGVLSDEIDEGMVTSSLSPDLLYACRYWIDHLRQGQQEIVDGDKTHLFLQKHFLHWLEAMSLTRESSKCVSLLNNLQALISPSANSISAFLNDAKRFVLRFQFGLADAPLQIYSSALMFAPEMSLVRQTFIDQVSVQFEIQSFQEKDWDASYITLEGHSKGASAVAFSPDGQLIASASFDGTLQLWETDTGLCRSTFEGKEWVLDVAFSLDGQLVASVSNNTVRLWEVATGTCRSVLKESANINSISFPRDGQLYTLAWDNRTVQLWDIETGMHRSVLQGHDWIAGAVFSPDGQLVASISQHTVQLWETETWTCYRTLTIRSPRSTRVVFSPDRQLFALDGVKTIQLFEVETGTCRCVIDTTVSDHAPVFSPDGQLVAWKSDETVRLHETKTGTCRSMFKGHSEPITALAFSPNARIIASASWDKTVRLWDTTKETSWSTIESHSSYSKVVEFSPDGRLVASGSSDGTVRLWEVATGLCCNVLEGHSERITAIAFSLDGQLVASVSWDKTIRTWEVATGQCRSILSGHSQKIVAMAFSPNGQLMASVSSDKTVRLWELATGKCCNILVGHWDDVEAVAFSLDGQLVASASLDSTVRLWEVATGKCHSILRGHSEETVAIVFSPDGHLVASASWDRTVRLWEVETGSCRNILRGHLKGITATAFSSDGQLVASASWDRKVRVWEVAAGRCHCALDTPFILSRLCFSPDNRVLRTSQGDIPLPESCVAASFCRSQPPTIPRPQLPSSRLGVKDDWIWRDRQRFLWLPPDYRSEATGVYGDVVCIGRSSGRVVLLRISVS